MPEVPTTRTLGKVPEVTRLFTQRAAKESH